MDALGMSTILDACADDLLPGISVLITRARYLSFFCWARSITKENITEEIHRWEVSLAKREHIIHLGGKTECSWLGKRKIAHEAGPTKNPGWLAYRPALLAAKLVNNKAVFDLTEDGDRLALLYKGSASPPKHPDGKWRGNACLSEVESDERNALRGIIGFSNRGGWKCQQKGSWDKRRKTIQTLKQWAGSNDGSVSLIDWIRRRRFKTGHGRVIAQAGGWASLAFGMTVLLVAWIEGSDDKSGRASLVRAIKSARRTQRAVHKVTSIDKDKLQDHENICKAFSAARQGVAALESLGCKRAPGSNLGKGLDWNA